jgi:hypothetical protein
VIERLGGALEVAKRANVHQVTVDRWRRTNRIPKKYHAVLGLSSKQLDVK